MANCLPRNTVFSELVYELAGQDVIEKPIDLTDETLVRGLLPGGAPEDGKNLGSGEKRAVTVGEMRCRCGAIRRSFRAMQWNNSNWMFRGFGRFFLMRFRSHLGLLVRCEMNYAAGVTGGQNYGIEEARKSKSGRRADASKGQRLAHQFLGSRRPENYRAWR